MREIQDSLSGPFNEEGDQIVATSLSMYTVVAGFIIGNLIVCSLFYLVYLVL
ncbi:MAG TPA: hypothetical protein VGN20_27275 [Mucilaginibacter sp.]|jgi:hypothetical protein